MMKIKIQSTKSLMDEMRAVARGEIKAPKDAAKPSFTVEAIMRLLTPENRKLMATIRDKEPDSVSELSAMTGRAQPNLTRTLAKLEAAGLVKAEHSGNRKGVRVVIKKKQKLVYEIDPFSMHDRLRVA